MAQLRPESRSVVLGFATGPWIAATLQQSAPFRVARAGSRGEKTT